MPKCQAWCDARGSSTVTLFIAKPIMWNIEGYRRPSGVRIGSGYPHKHGFGHEEWNNAPALSFREDGVEMRAFHTERVGNAPVDDEAGSTFVFMYASHDGVQELVGVAGGATCLIDDEPRRRALAGRLRLDRLQTQAWAVPRVRELHGQDRTRFDAVWAEDLAWIPNWLCPADAFLWLDEPAPLDARAIRGTGKLLSMFGRHTNLDVAEAVAMLEAVPVARRDATWCRIRARIDAEASTAVGDDLDTLRRRRGLKPTERKRLIDARLGQGRFRRDVERLWGGACSVSGCAVREALRASHIKPWKPSDDRERLDGDNGLLLTADLDALFDRGLVSFADDGGMLVAERIGRSDRRLFRLPRPLRRPPTSAQRRYLADHRLRWTFD